MQKPLNAKVIKFNENTEFSHGHDRSTKGLPYTFLEERAFQPGIDRARGIFGTTFSYRYMRSNTLELFIFGRAPSWLSKSRLN
jgi:hypothetical protein